MAEELNRILQERKECTTRLTEQILSLTDTLIDWKRTEDEFNHRAEVLMEKILQRERDLEQATGILLKIFKEDCSDSSDEGRPAKISRSDDLTDGSEKEPDLSTADRIYGAARVNHLKFVLAPITANTAKRIYGVNSPKSPLFEQKTRKVVLSFIKDLADKEEVLPENIHQLVASRTEDIRNRIQEEFGGT